MLGKVWHVTTAKDCLHGLESLVHQYGSHEDSLAEPPTSPARTSNRRTWFSQHRRVPPGLPHILTQHSCGPSA